MSLIKQLNWLTRKGTDRFTDNSGYKMLILSHEKISQMLVWHHAMFQIQSLIKCSCMCTPSFSNLILQSTF